MIHSGKEIMFMNVCPLATDNLNQLSRLKKELGNKRMERYRKACKNLG